MIPLQYFVKTVHVGIKQGSLPVTHHNPHAMHTDYSYWR